jgi:hypothetical protein
MTIFIATLATRLPLLLLFVRCNSQWHCRCHGVGLSKSVVIVIGFHDIFDAIIIVVLHGSHSISYSDLFTFINVDIFVFVIVYIVICHLYKVVVCKIYMQNVEYVEGSSTDVRLFKV